MSRTIDSDSTSGPTGAVMHVVLLTICTLALAATFLLHMPDGRHVQFVMADRPLPDLCVVQKYVGTPCPGCGLTRSFVSIAHGRMENALRYNVAGPLVFALVVFQLPYRVLQIHRVRSGRVPYYIGRPATYFVWLLVIVLMSRWLVSWIPLLSG